MRRTKEQSLRRSRAGTRGRSVGAWARVALGGLLMAGAMATASTASAAPTPTSDVGSATAKVNLADVALAQWNGDPGQGIGADPYRSGSTLPGTGLLRIGDVNGDGRPDVAFSSAETFNQAGASVVPPSVYVMFTRPSVRGQRSLDAIPPADGYRIEAPALDSASGEGYQRPTFSYAGDQNGDGVPDLLVSISDYSSVRNFVVYGVKDPSTLPTCDGPGNPTGNPTRCLSLENLAQSGHGYELTGEPSWGTGGTSAGDFDGDGTPDFVFSSADGVEHIVKGMPRTGDVDLSTLPANQQITVTLPGGGGFFPVGLVPQFIGDINGDGRQDLGLVGAPVTGDAYILYGRSFSSGSVSVPAAFGLSASDGLNVGLPSLTLPAFASVGDVNGDGQTDVAIGSLGLLATDTGSVSMEYLPKGPSSDPIATGSDIDPRGGYAVNPAPNEPAGIGGGVASVGDADGDGINDVITSGAATTVNGASGAGAAYVLFSKRTAPAQPITVGSTLTGDNGVALVGSSANDQAGQTVAAAGDVDGDGLPDYLVGAPGTNGGGGTVYLVPGSAFMAQARTGGVSNVAATAASLNAVVTPNGRDTQVWFQYGATSAYGSTTTPSSVTGSDLNDAVVGSVTGLSASTAYHYRVVAKNNLGVTRYGKDQTFTTGQTPASGGGTSTDPCQVNPKAPGCSGYDYCQANPTVAACKSPVAVLGAVFVSPKSATVKRGKKTKVSISVVNTGTGVASGVKVCLKASSKLVKGSKCTTVASLGAGKTVTKSFTVTVQKKAKRGKKAPLSFTVSATGVRSVTAKGAVKVA